MFPVSSLWGLLPKHPLAWSIPGAWLWIIYIYIQWDSMAIVRSFSGFHGKWRMTRYSWYIYDILIQYYIHICTHNMRMPFFHTRWFILHILHILHIYIYICMYVYIYILHKYIFIYIYIYCTYIHIYIYGIYCIYCLAHQETRHVFFFVPWLLASGFRLAPRQYAYHSQTATWRRRNPGATGPRGIQRNPRGWDWCPNYWGFWDYLFSKW